MSKPTKGKRGILLVSLALVILLGAFALLYYQNTIKPAVGAKTIEITIMHSDGSAKQYTLNTDAEFLSGALEEENLIQGKEADFGLYIVSADGETADEAKQQWWCITKSGEQVNTGVDTTPIADGDRYELTLKTGW